MLEPYTSFEWIPFPLHAAQLGMIGSLLIWYLVLRFQQSRCLSANSGGPKVNGETWSLSDSYLAAVTIALLVYKVWPVILQPSLLWEQGIGVIFYAGGPYVQLAVVVVFGGWLWWDGRRHGVPWTTLVRPLLAGFLPALTVDALLLKEYGTVSSLPFGYKLHGVTVHPINVYFLAFLLPWFVVYWWRRAFFEKWFLFSYSAFLILLQPLRMQDGFFYVLHGKGWAWGGLMLGIVWFFFADRDNTTEKRS